jgi:hypothetical protein
MLKSNSGRSLAGAAALGALATMALIAGGTESARADEIYFGNITPSSGLGTAPACTHASGDAGFVCSNGQTFTAEGSTFTATGYSDTFSTATALTWKPASSAGGVSNSLGESGLGENQIGPQNPAQPCTDNPGVGGPSPVCEIGVNASVAVTSTKPITDMLVGSVQAGAERFQVYAGTSIIGLGLHPFDGVLSSTNCTAGPDGDECLITGLPSGTTVVGVVDLASNPAGAASDVLLTAVSLVPAPPIGHGLFVLLAIGGVLFGGKLLESFKKHRLQAV